MTKGESNPCEPCNNASRKLWLVLLELFMNGDIDAVKALLEDQPELASGVVAWLARV